MTEQPKIIWRSTCGVCSAGWQIEGGEENPQPHGSFCPDCQERGVMAKGVLNWSREQSDKDVNMQALAQCARMGSDMLWLAGNMHQVYVSVNDQRGCYQTALQEIEEHEASHGPSSITWAAEGDRERCIEQNWLVKVQVYPRTPVGFVDIWGVFLPTVVRAMREAMETGTEIKSVQPVAT